MKLHNTTRRTIRLPGGREVVAFGARQPPVNGVSSLRKTRAKVSVDIIIPAGATVDVPGWLIGEEATRAINNKTLVPVKEKQHG